MKSHALVPLSFGVVAFVAAFASSGEARANHLDACGGLFLEADAAARCEVVTKETCEQQCQPVAVERVCASRLYTSCEGECAFTAEVDCQAGCEETCVPSCESTIETQPPNCMGLCMSDCQQGVTDSCGAEDGANGECRSSGAQCCQEKCEGQCQDMEVVECTPSCETACSGSCTGRANIDCQVECQSRTFTTCKDEVVQECHDECETTGAAIFCDGHFLATGGDLQACADALAAAFSVEIDVDIDVDVDVNDDDDDEDDIEDALSCSVADPSAGGIALGMLALFGIGAWRFRRVRRAS